MRVTQADFESALLDPQRPVPAGLRDGQAQPAGRRFDVYRNNVAASLTEALHTGFPVIARLLGKENMDGLAGLYLRRHPPKSPLMMYYGEDFPAFLETKPQLSHLGYLGDVARLELALRRAYHAADAPPIAPQTLGALSPEALVDTRFSLAPALHILRSPWPVHDIWRMNTSGGARSVRAGAQDICVVRKDLEPRPELLPAGGAAFVEALNQGQPLGRAHDAGQNVAPEFDAGPVLALLLNGQAIISLSTKD